MRETERDGLCPIADKAPSLWEENDVAVDIFYQCHGSATIIHAKDKDWKYLNPTDYCALINMYTDEKYDRERLVKKILILEKINNDKRPNRPKPKKR